MHAKAVFDGFAFVFGRPFSNDGNPVLVECAAGCETMKNKKRVRIFAPVSASEIPVSLDHG